MTLLRFSVGPSRDAFTRFFRRRTFFFAAASDSFWSRSEDLAAFAARQDPKLLAILRNGSTRDFDVLISQELDDALVGVRMLGVLLRDDLANLQLHRLRREIVAVGARDARVEEVL